MVKVNSPLPDWKDVQFSSEPLNLHALRPDEEKAVLDDCCLDAGFEDYVVEEVRKSLRDPRPPVPLDEAFARIDRLALISHEDLPG